MPKKKRQLINLPPKRFWKKKIISEKPGTSATVPHSETALQNAECLSTDKHTLTDVPRIDKAIQTEELIKNDHDYCANVSTSCIADDVCISYCEPKTAFIDCSTDNNVMNQNDNFCHNLYAVECTEVESTSFPTVVLEVVNQLNGHNFSTFVTADKLGICKMYVHSSAEVQFSIELKSDFTCNVFVHWKPLSKTHEIWDNLPVLFDCSSAVIELCERTRKYGVCCGNYEEEFTSLVGMGVGLSNYQHPDIVAYKEGDFGAKQFSSTIRTFQCDLFSSSERCNYCKEYRKALHKRKYRKEEKLDSNRSYSQITYKHQDMSRESLIEKIAEQHSEIKCLQSEVSKLNIDYEKHFQLSGIKEKEIENNQLKELMSCCNRDFEKASSDAKIRQRLFWKQQLLHSDISDAREMRWHPIILRWCFHLQQKSEKAYAALRNSGFINLPSPCTLLHYSHDSKGKLDFESEVFELSKDETKTTV